ncbi:MAG: LPS-assembly protein LptD [Gammaproteobacteria bacterium]|nr:LPS-assembly protein LptD [Gammaproteobacteria bacterium]
MCEKSSRYNSLLFISGILFLTLGSQNTFADTGNNTLSNNLNLNLCRTEDSAATKHTRPRIFSSEDINNTEISADFTQSSSDGSTSLDGNVVIEKHLLRVSADHAHYDRQKEELQVSGNVHIDTEKLSLDADSGTVNMNITSEINNTQGYFKNIKFFIPDSNMKGKAETIHARDSDNINQHSILNNASITSCDLFDPDWFISAEKIKLDHVEEYGSADDVVVRFKGIPFLYTPYIEFPTSNRRRSGLLFPELGSSSSRGIELAMPWYWNIAPNQDALITPRYMEKRGLGLDGDYRYLTKSTNGELKGSYLRKDDIAEEERYQVDYKQHSSISSNLLFDVNLRDISDANYFNDFSSSIGTTSQTHLDRSAALRYDLHNWHMRALIQDIKTIDDAAPLSERPYERLPQLTLNGDTQVLNSPLLFTLDSELVDFTHEDDSIITGTRFILRPGFHLPISGNFWFIDPAVKLSHTQYDVDANAVGAATVSDRNLLIGSVDAGLFFERFLKNGYQHTLEPRLYYLNVPFEDQSNAPLFDTSTPDFSVSQLFRDNRFIGGDRVGDTNQLTLALTSRVINPNTGNELVRASIGQIYYFEDRKVSLDGSIDTSSQSDVIAELETNWGRWKSTIDLQLDIKDSTLSKEHYFLHYLADARHLFNIGYRKRIINKSIDIEQTDTSFVYAINNEYSSFVRWNYSLKDNKNIDSIAGIAYDSCCWSIQLLAQRRLQNSTTINDVYDNSILVQFVFKGLGSLSGSTAKTTLEQSIYGYTDVLH